MKTNGKNELDHMFEQYTIVISSYYCEMLFLYSREVFVVFVIYLYNLIIKSFEIASCADLFQT